MKSELRKTDELCADIVTSFMEKYFYNKVQDYHRILTKDDQVKGIDSTFVLNNKEYKCDEKAAIRYVNKPLKTFSLELSFIGRDDKIHNGWLLDEHKVNNSFLFIWIDKGKKDLLTSINDIQVLEYALVDRNSIIEHLNSLGWSLDKLFTKMNYIRCNSDESLGNLYKNGCKFAYSQHLVEKPINILLTRTKLIELADYTDKIIIDEKN